MDFEVSELQGAEARIEELEEKLAAQTRLLRTIIDNPPMAIYAKDAGQKNTGQQSGLG